MIIKMEVESFAFKESGNGPFEKVRTHWKFIDALQDVDSRDIDKDSIPPADAYSAFYLIANRETSECTRVWIQAKRSNGDEVCVVSDRTVYLLNDNGKTIERLN